MAKRPCAGVELCTTAERPRAVCLVLDGLGACNETFLSQLHVLVIFLLTSLEFEFKND